MEQNNSLLARRWLGRMRRALAATALGLACAQAFAQATPTWTTLGPPGGAVSALLANPVSTTTLYAGTPGNGVFFSTDGGATWSLQNTGLATAVVGRQALHDIHALVSDPQFVYAATGAGVFSAPLGAAPNWTALAATGASAAPTMLAYDPASSLLFAASPGTDGISTPGVYVAPSLSAQGSALTWTFVALPFATAGLGVDGLAVASPNGAMGASSLLVSAGGAVYSAPIAMSFPISLPWTNADAAGALAGGSIAALAYSADFLQAYACSAGVPYYSGNPLDPQALWSLAIQPATGDIAPICHAFQSVPVSAGGAPQLLVGTDQGALVSTDGVTFSTTAALGPGTAAESFAIGSLPGSMTSTLFVGTSFGVATAPVVALLPGASWTASNGPATVASGAASQRLDNTSVVDAAVIGTRLFAAAVDNRYTEVFASADGGATWSATAVGSVLGMGETVIALVPDTTNKVLYAATTQGLLAYLPATSQWVAVSPGTIIGRTGALALGATALFVGTDNGVFALPRGTAPAAAVPVAAGLTGSSVRSLLVASGSVLAGTIDATDNNYVFFTSESGAALGTGLWQAFGVGSAGTSRITSMLLVGGNLLAATSGNLVLYASTGSGWASANTSSVVSQQIADDFGVVNSLASDGVSVYAATSTQGVFASPLGAAFFWTPFNGSGASALSSMEVRSLRAAGDGNVYAATRAGVASFVAASATGPTPPPSSPTPSGSSGGGAVDGWLAGLLLVALLLLRPGRSPVAARRP
jgi:hypothetical protein